MSAADFYTMERLIDGRTHFFVVHPSDPKFTLEVEPEVTPEGELAVGTIRRICLPNSWTGNYHRRAALIGDALSFFRRAMADGTARPGRLASG